MALPPLPPSVSRPLTESRSTWARRSVTLKLVAIGFLVVILMIPAFMLSGLISERQQLRDTARREVADSWGQEQTLGGPVLTVPYVVRQTTETGTVMETTSYAHFFPDRLDVTGTVSPETRKRGIYEVVLYNARLQIRGRFPRPDPAALNIPPESFRPGDAFLSIGLSDMTGIKDGINVNWAGTVRAADPGIPSSDVFSSGVHVPVALTETAEGYSFGVDLNLNGSGSLGFLPVGKETNVQVAADWGTPSFIGAFLPDERTVTADRFEASWRVLNLNRNYGQAFIGAFGQPTQLVEPGAYYDPYVQTTEMTTGGTPSAFGVSLLLPIDEYQKTERAAKYCMLFVFLTFTTFFFVEILGGRRIHPVQYLLVGFAITLFYLLLLSFSEYIPFGSAYGTAALAVLTLVTLYAKAIFREWKLAGMVAGLLALFYGYFYVLLQLEAYALLFGSLGLLATLAVVMYLSRSVDWYGFGQSATEPPAPPPSPAPTAPVPGGPPPPALSTPGDAPGAASPDVPPAPSVPGVGAPEAGAPEASGPAGEPRPPGSA